MGSATKKKKRSFFSFLNATPKEIAVEIKRRREGQEPSQARTKQPHPCLLCEQDIVKDQFYFPASSIRSAHVDCIKLGLSGKIEKTEKADKPVKTTSAPAIETNGAHSVEPAPGTDVTDASLNYRLGALEREVEIWKELYRIERARYEDLFKKGH